MNENLKRNEGVIVSGHGQFHARQLAVGSHAAIVAVESAGQALRDQRLDDIADKLMALTAELNEQGQHLADANEVLAAVLALADQVRAEKPSRPAITALLNSITSSVQSVSSLMTAAEALRTAVLPLFGG